MAQTQIATPAPEKLDIQIVNASLSAIQVELFNFDNSQTHTYNAAVNTYHPMTGATPLIVTVPGTNAYALIYVAGPVTTFTDASAPIMPNTTPNMVAFSETGALVYRPGIPGDATLTLTDILTINSKQTSYRHLLNSSASSPFLITDVRITVGQYHLAQINEGMSYVKTNVVGESTASPISPDTYKNENQQQNNIVTFPVMKPINRKTGLWYNVLPRTTDTTGNDVSNIINMSVFFIPRSAKMLGIKG